MRSPQPRDARALALTKTRAQELKKRHEDEKNRLEQLFLKEQAGRRDDQVPPQAHPAGLASRLRSVPDSGCGVTRRPVTRGGRSAV